MSNELVPSAARTDLLDVIADERYSNEFVGMAVRAAPLPLPLSVRCLAGTAAADLSWCVGWIQAAGGQVPKNTYALITRLNRIAGGEPYDEA